MQFKVFHTYNKLARQGKCKPLECTCGNDLQVQLGANDEPVLKCYYCGAEISPGQAMYANMVAVVQEWRE